MDHPLRDDSNISLRGRVVQLLKIGFSVLRDSNIVFVCGGNEEHQMRPQFETEFPNILACYEYFKPEYAMKNYFTLGDHEQFDIADFEQMVGQLSRAIVLFPEAPGSFAELGYFSGEKDLARKTVLVLDSNHQEADSFISLGPANKIAKISQFQPTIQMDYKNPAFGLVATRILERAALKERRKRFDKTEFSKLSSFELFALIHKVVELLVVATPEDIIYVLRGMYESHVSPSDIKKMISILVGSERLREVGDFGHLSVKEGKEQSLLLQEGFKTELFEIKIEISAMLSAAHNGIGEVLKELDEC